MTPDSRLPTPDSRLQDSRLTDSRLTDSRLKTPNSYINFLGSFAMEFSNRATSSASLYSLS